jgi:predicted Zn finger-like uncharacterized protein
MPTTVACPECGSKLRVPEELSGQEVRCARCGGTFIAPGSVPDTPADTHHPPDQPPFAAPLPPPAAPPGEDLAFRLNLSLDDDPADRPQRAIPLSAEPEPPPPRRPALNDDHDDLQDCPSCGKHLHRDYRRCPYCGTRLARAEREQRAYPRRHRRDAEPHRGGTVLTLGILGLVLFPCMPVGLICGILAWVLGQSDLARMKTGEMDSSGEGLTHAGWVCGIIATVLGGLILVGCGPIWFLSLLRRGF